MLKIGLSVVLVLASTWVALAQSGIEECIYKQGSKQAIVGARRVLQPDEVDTGHRICMGARLHDFVLDVVCVSDGEKTAYCREITASSKPYLVEEHRRARAHLKNLP